MPNRQTAPLGAPTWIDVLTSDAAATQAFYTELFGWTVVDPGPDYGGYFNFHKDGVPVAGGMINGEEGHEDAWTTYFASSDAEATVAAVQAAGGTVFLPAMAVLELGSMAVVGDPGGHSAGIWQAGQHTGFGVLGEPGTPSWFELQTRTFAEDVAFYTEVLGWTTLAVSDADDFRYSMFVDGDDQLGGIMDATVFPAEAPTGWSIYFGTADAEASVARAVELGATLTIGPDDTPYGVLAGLVDPTGAAFKLRQDPAQD